MAITSWCRLSLPQQIATWPLEIHDDWHRLPGWHSSKIPQTLHCAAPVMVSPTRHPHHSSLILIIQHSSFSTHPSSLILQHSSSSSITDPSSFTWLPHPSPCHEPVSHTRLVLAFNSALIFLRLFSAAPRSHPDLLRLFSAWC